METNKAQDQSLYPHARVCFSNDFIKVFLINIIAEIKKQHNKNNIM